MLKPTTTSSVIALVCLLLLVPGPALAQVNEIIEDFCEDVEDDAEDVVDTAEDLADDLEHAAQDFLRCLDRVDDLEERLNCSDELFEEVLDGFEQAANSCADIVEDFSRDVERALTEAVAAGVVDEFVEDPRVNAKLLFGLNTIAQCSAALNP